MQRSNLSSPHFLRFMQRVSNNLDRVNCQVSMLTNDYVAEVLLTTLGMLDVKNAFIFH
jgi:hypothetical protein